MTDPQTDVVKATVEAQAAREKLQRDMHALQERLDPNTIKRQAQDRLSGIKSRLSDTGVSVAGATKRNPTPVAGGLAVIALFLVRKPIARLFRRRSKNTYSDGKPVVVTSTSHQSGEVSS